MAIWLSACYWVRFHYIEVDWLVDYCAANASAFVCEFRAGMGKAMYLNYLGYAAITLALPAFLIKGRVGVALAVLALLASCVALCFNNASLGAPAVLLALIRLARAAIRPAVAPRPAAG